MGEVDEQIAGYHRRIGEFITRNVMLEAYLGLLIRHVLARHVPDPFKFGEALLATHQWTKGKIEITNVVAQNFLSGQNLTWWEGIYADVRKLNTFRGDIAHSGLAVLHDSDEKTSNAILIKGGKSILEKGAWIKSAKLDEELARYNKALSAVGQLIDALLVEKSED